MTTMLRHGGRAAARSRLPVAALRALVGGLSALFVLLAPTTDARPAAAGAFGRQAAGSVWFEMGADYKRSSRFALDHAATVTELVAYLDGLGSGTGTQQVRFAVYADNAGAPGGLLAQTAIGTIANGAQPSWVELPVATPLPLAPGAYHLAIHSGSTSRVARYSRQPVAGALRSASDAFADGASAVYGSSSSDDYEIAIYASAATTAPVSAPVNSTLPSITGTPEVGATLTATAGEWSGSPTGYVYDWRRCDAAGGNCASTGASAPSYTIVGADAGRTLRVGVTASNGGGTATAVSAPSPVVQASTVTETGVSSFGRQAPGSEWFEMGANYKRSSRFTLDRSATATDLVAYLDGRGSATTSQEVRFAVYADAAGSPGALLAQTTVGTIAGGAPAAWVELPVENRVTLAPGAYHLAILSGATSRVARYSRRPLAGGLRTGNDAFADGASSFFGVTASDDYEAAIFAVVAPSATASCDRYASPAGADTSLGTAATPFRTVGALIGSLGSGDTGCLYGNAGAFPVENLTIGKSVTLTSVSGQRAVFRGSLYLNSSARGTTLRDFDLDNSSSPYIAVKLNADDVTISNMEITNDNKPNGTSNYNGICVLAGPGFENGDAYIVSNLLVEKSRIHNCGDDNHEHSLYLEGTRNPVIRDNYLYGNFGLGLDLYPDTQGMIAEYNVIYGNSRNGKENVGFAGEVAGGEYRYDHASSNNIVRYSVITNAVTRYNVDSYFPSSRVLPTGNVVTDNCVWNAPYGNFGYDRGTGDYTQTNNKDVDPKYVDPAGGDFRLQAGSPCAGYGPRVVPAT